MIRKVLWLVGTGQRQDFLDRAKFIGADTVCVRTTNGWLKGAIEDIHTQGLKVYGWRWPARTRPTLGDKPLPPHWYADDEAAFAVELIDAGLDGYIVDPESDNDKNDDDWDDAIYAPVATRFCETVRTAGKQKNPQFHFGVTSGCTQPTNNKHIPWKEFVGQSDAVHPQLYWAPNIHSRETPEAAFDVGMKSWKTITPAGMPVHPIIGEIARNTADEIHRCRALLHAGKHTEVHCYTYETDAGVPSAHWDALKALDAGPA
jgi:hypothetical protein